MAEKRCSYDLSFKMNILKCLNNNEGNIARTLKECNIDRKSIRLLTGI